MTFKSRLEKLEKDSKVENAEPVRLIVLRPIVSPGEVEAPHRYAIVNEQVFTAADGESEDEFYQRIERELPEYPLVVQCVSYTEKQWYQLRPYERIIQNNHTATLGQN